MDPFKVICVTCKAKLAVRNEALIGQILACPRCGSMVEVAKPSATAAAAAAATASTASTINLSARQIEEAYQVAAATEPETTPEPLATSVEAAETVPLEALQVTTEVTKYKVITWSLASFVIGATLVGAILYKGRAPAKQQPTQALAELTGGLPSNETESTPNVEEPLVVEPEFETTPPAEEPEKAGATAEVAVEPDVLSVEEPPQPIDAPAPIEPTPPEPEVDETPTLTVEPAVPTTRPFNPLQFDLASLSLAKLDQARDPDTQAVNSPEADTAIDAAEQVPVVDDEPFAPTVVRRGRPNKKAPIDRSADKQLKLLIPAIEFKDLPLLDALRLVSQLSGQPVSVAPEQLLMAGITSQKNVSLKATDISLREALDKILEPLQLEHATDGPQIIVTRQDAAKLREIKYPVDDLLAGEWNADELATWIEQLIAPDTWQTAGGNGLIESSNGSLRITQPQHVQYQVLILLERLRLARNLSPKSRYPVARLVGAPAPELLAEKLSTNATFTFTADTPLDQVFAHWQTELGAPLLVDWPSLAKADMHPSTPIACAIVNEPWHVALDRVLQPLDLGWRAVTGGAIEITSATKTRRALQVELFKVQPLDDAMLANLQDLAAEHGTNNSAAFVYDPVGKVVLVAQPATAMRAIYRQLRDENLLDVR